MSGILKAEEAVADQAAAENVQHSKMEMILVEGLMERKNYLVQNIVNGWNLTKTI